MATAQKDEIKRLEKLIEVGDFREARKAAKQLQKDGGLSETEQETVAQALKQTGTDPYVIAALLITLGIIVFLYIKFGL